MPAPPPIPPPRRNWAAPAQRSEPRLCLGILLAFSRSRQYCSAASRASALGHLPWIEEKLDRLPNHMDRDTRLAWLLLLLLTLPWGAPENAVQVLTNVTGILGGSTTLVCTLTAKKDVSIIQVTWTKLKNGFHTVAVFHYTKGPSITDSERMKFLATKMDKELWNASLAISNLGVEDEGNYQCQFATYPDGSKSATTKLRVLARPTTTAKALTPSPTSERQVVAQCISTGGRPAPQIKWLSDVNGTIHEDQKPGPQLGTITVTNSFLLEPSRQADGKNITCQVEHETLRHPDLQTVTLSTVYPPDVSISGYDSNWYPGRTNVTLTCDAQSKPKPTSYEWSTTTGPLPNTTEAQGNQLQIPIVDKDSINNVTFVCNVINAVGSGQYQVTVLVKEPELPLNSGLGTGDITAIACTIIAAAFLVSSAFLLYKRGLFERFRSRPRSSETTYTPVNNGNCIRDTEMNGMR
ncbi:poliovirus receptor [Sigmodon hispidus]